MRHARRRVLLHHHPRAAPLSWGSGAIIPARLTLRSFNTYLPVSKVFYDATQYFSRQKPPNLVNVLPAIDRVHNSLTDSSLDANYRPSIRAAASLGQATLNRYYKKTDDSELYRIAMSTSPRLGRRLGQILTSPYSPSS